MDRVTMETTTADKHNLFVKKLKRIWEEHNFQFGIPVVDLQHIHLLHTFMDLGYVLDAGTGNVQQEYENAFSRILDFTSEHFFLETEIFRKFDFPRSKEHLRQHGEFINKLKRRSRDKTEGSPHVARQLVGDMMSWLFDHILVEDKQYADFFRNEPHLIIDFTNELVDYNEIHITRQQVNNYRLVTGLEVDFSIQDEDIHRTIYHMWKTYDLSVNIPIIDLQHVWFLYLMVKMDRASRISRRQDRIQALVSGFEHLHRYFITHFNTEEKIMEEFQFPGLAQHRMQHAKLRARFDQWAKEIERREERNLLSISQLLKDWLMSHIAISDKDLMVFFRDKKPQVKAFSKQLVSNGTIHISKGQISLHNRVFS